MNQSKLIMEGTPIHRVRDLNTPRVHLFVNICCELKLCMSSISFIYKMKYISADFNILGINFISVTDLWNSNREIKFIKNIRYWDRKEQ